MSDSLPLSAVIPTRHRAAALLATLSSLAAQSAQPSEVVIVDASDDVATRDALVAPPTGLRAAVRWFPAATRGAASQRNEGVARATHPVIAFFDDDIRFEGECVARLWAALQSDPGLGAVNATIINQGYSRPGQVTRLLYRVLHGPKADYAGRVLGPGVNLLPDDRPDLPEVVPVEWLNTTCTLYRRTALPDPPFPAHFTGYSLCEDLTLSLTVGRKWKLANARTARIFHDSQPGDHKRSAVEMAAMELVNRHFVMTRVLGRRGVGDYLRLAAWETYQVAAAARGGVRRAAAEVAGKVRGLARVAAGSGR